MAEYPTIPIPALDGFSVAPIWKTITSGSDAMTEQRKQKAVFAKYDVAIKYPEGITPSEAQALWTFYMARKGAYGSFYVYDLVSFAHVGLFVGWGTGAALTFDLPGKTTSAQVIKIDGITKTLTTDYSIVVGGGGESSDRVTFVAAPALGALITCDITGYLRMRVRFKEDQLPRNTFLLTIYRGGSVELTGISPEGL